MDVANTNLDYRDPEWVAEKLGLDKATVYKFLHEGSIPAVQLGRKWLISERRLAEWLEKEAQRQTQARREALGSAHRAVRRMENFTAGARMALKQAHTEARGYGHTALGQEHLLLGLLAESTSPVARALKRWGIDTNLVRRVIQERCPAGEGPVSRRLGRTPEAKRAMRLAGQLARRSGEGTLVGTDHLLIGLLLSRRGLGHEIVSQKGIGRKGLEEALQSEKQEKGAIG